MTVPSTPPAAGTALRAGPDRPPPLPPLPLPRRTLPAWLTVPAGAVAVVVVTAAALLVPVAAVGAAGLAGLVALFWWRPRTGLLLTAVAALLVTQLGALAGAAGGALDEGMIVVGAVVVTLRRLLTTGTLVRFPGTWWFVGFGLAGLASSLLQDVPTTLWLAGGLLLLKAVLVGHTAAQLTWDETHLRVLVRAGVVVAVALVVTGVLNVALPGLWTGVVAQTRPEMHGPVAAVVGPFRQPAAYGRIAVVLAAATLTYQLVVRATLRGYVLAVALSGLSLLTFRVKSFVGLVLAVAGVVLRAGRPWVVRLVLVALPALLLVAGPVAWRYVVEDLELYYGGGDSARALLTAGGLALAAEHLPLGAGLGRYGSATAAEHYSPEYVRLGFEHVWGLGRADGWGAYLLDTQWPALLGETGWLGTVCYAAGLLCALVALLRPVPGETPLVRWLRISGVCALVLVLLDSVGAAAFSSPPSYVLLYLAPGMVAAMRVRARTGVPEPAGVAT